MWMTCGISKIGTISSIKNKRPLRVFFYLRCFFFLAGLWGLIFLIVTLCGLPKCFFPFSLVIKKSILLRCRAPILSLTIHSPHNMGFFDSTCITSPSSYPCLANMSRDSATHLCSPLPTLLLFIREPSAVTWPQLCPA